MLRTELRQQVFEQLASPEAHERVGPHELDNNMLEVVKYGAQWVVNIDVARFDVALLFTVLAFVTFPCFGRLQFVKQVSAVDGRDVDFRRTIGLDVLQVDAIGIGGEFVARAQPLPVVLDGAPEQQVSVLNSSVRNWRKKSNDSSFSRHSSMELTLIFFWLNS